MACLDRRRSRAGGGAESPRPLGPLRPYAAGWGHPYSAAQLSRVLRDNMFTPTRTQRALYVPPIGNYTFLRSAPAGERMGARFFPTFSGVVLIEAGKHISAGTAKPAKQRKLARHGVVSRPKDARRNDVRDIVSGQEGARR